MKKESYLEQPQAIELHEVDTGTDIILRRNIEQTEKEDIHDGETQKYTVWECEEVQYRYKGKVTADEVAQKLDYWWAIAEGMSEVEAIDDQAKKNNEPTVIERLEAIESGMAELAEVICNG